MLQLYVVSKCCDYNFYVVKGKLLFKTLFLHVAALVKCVCATFL